MSKLMEEIENDRRYVRVAPSVAFGTIKSMEKLIAKASNARFGAEVTRYKEETVKRRGKAYQGDTHRGELKVKVTGTEVNVPESALKKKE